MFQTSLRILLHPMSFGWLIDWPDSHSGFLVALATFTLAGSPLCTSGSPIDW
jgi:hypothetical protein